MYRSRPKENLDNDVLEFLSSLKYDQYLVDYDILGSESHSIMLYEKGHIKLEELRKILSSLESARKNSDKISTHGFEDIHEAIEAYVIGHAGMNAGGKMHTARSRNDQVVLDMRMKVRDDINEICAALVDLVEGMVEKAEETKRVPMPMYTHLQQGQIGTFSHYLLAYGYALVRDLERLYLAYQRINQSPLGACAIGGSSIEIDRKRTALLLGFDSIVTNSIDATSSRDVFLEYVAALSIMASSVSRIAEDFIIWSTSEFGYLELADRYSSTSSAMPQKKNPDPLELIRSRSAMMAANLAAMLGIVKALPSGYSRDLQDFKTPLIESSMSALAMLRIMNGLVRSVQINARKMAEGASSSYAISLDIAEQLVMKKEIPFRVAHKLVGGLVELAVARGNITLANLETDDIAAAIKALKLNVSPVEVREIIKSMTPDRSLRERRSTGSPNLNEQAQMIKSLSQSIKNYRIGVQKRIKLVEGSLDNLSKIVDKFLKT